MCEDESVFSTKIEQYLVDLVSDLVAFKSQSALIRNSTVAVPSVQANSTVTSREVCRTLRTFAGVSVPDITSLSKVPPAVETFKVAIPIPEIPLPKPVKKRGRPSTKNKDLDKKIDS